MKKEWICQLAVLFIFYLNSIIYVEHEGIIFSETPITNLLFVLYIALLFLIVNYIFIPKLFYRKKYILFFLSLISAIAIFGIIEEGIIEKNI